MASLMDMDVKSPMDPNFAAQRMEVVFEEFFKNFRQYGTRAAKAIISDDVLGDLKGHAALNGLDCLMSHLGKDQLLMDSSWFGCFYNFVFFMCCEKGKRSIALSTSIEAWKLVLKGKFRLLEKWCDFLQEQQKYQDIIEDIWQMLLEFSFRVPENLEGYNITDHWPVIIDEFVEYMYRNSGQDTTPNTGLPGLKESAGNKRRNSTEAETQIQAINYISKRPGVMQDHNMSEGPKKMQAHIMSKRQEQMEDMFSKRARLSKGPDQKL